MRKSDVKWIFVSILAGIDVISIIVVDFAIDKHNFSGWTIVVPFLIAFFLMGIMIKMKK
ncbi:MAG: hypothetical protein GY679_01740 [Mycoplasma sp.]|nr:hypothetical protein [Mycoplasma sp.]